MASLPDTIAAAETEVRAIIREPTAQFWSSAQIQNFIKEGCVDLCAKTLCYKKVDSSTRIYDDVVWYAELSKTIKVLACAFYDSQASPVSYRGLVKIHPRMVGYLPANDDADPEYWYHFGDRVGIHPVPDSMNASDRLVIYYALTSETITDLPERYQPLVINYAAAMCFLKRRMNQAAVSMYTIYLNDVKFARNDLERMEVDNLNMFQIPSRTVKK